MYLKFSFLLWKVVKILAKDKDFLKKRKREIN